MPVESSIRATTRALTGISIPAWFTPRAWLHRALEWIDRVGLADEREFLCHIDAPSESSVDSRRLILFGWCYHLAGSTPVAVRCRIGRRVYEGTCDLERPDVKTAHPEAGPRSGFIIGVKLPHRRGKCRLEAKFEGDRWRRFHRLELFPARVSRSEELKQWVLFWVKTLGGDPTSWDLVSTSEREYLLYWAHRRNLIELGVTRQYPPRPVRPERFPRPRLKRDELPAVTIVTPTLNFGEFIEATMRSVLGQQGVELAYLIQDGGSTDASVDVIQRVAGADPRVRWRSEPDSGQADAICKGFEQSTGGPDDLMAYLNSDDLLMPGALRFVAEYFARHPDVDVLYGHRVLVDEAGLETGRWFTPRASCSDLRICDFIPQETLFWRRRIWNRVGGIDRSFQFALDWDLLLRFQAAKAHIVRVPWLIGIFRHHPRQKTQAWLADVGAAEMERLRERSFGRTLDAGEQALDHARSSFDSAVVKLLFERGVRV